MEPNTLKTMSDSEIAEMDEMDRQQSEARAMQTLYRKFGMRYASCTLGDFERYGDDDEQRRQDDACRHLAGMSVSRNLVITGSQGTGKDHLISAMLKIAIKEGRAVNWITGSELYARFRDAIGNANVKERDLIKELGAPDVLAISDPVGTGAPSAWERDILYRVVDHRYRHAKATWITLNVPAETDADELLTAYTVGRLRHDALIIKTNWPSYRKPAGRVG